MSHKNSPLHWFWRGRYDNISGYFTGGEYNSITRLTTLQLQHDLAGAITFDPFVGDGRPGDVAAELLQFFTLIGAPTHRRVQAKAVRVDAQL